MYRNTHSTRTPKYYGLYVHNEYYFAHNGVDMVQKPNCSSGFCV